MKTRILILAYATVIWDGERILLYYSARFTADFGGKGKASDRQLACVIESSEGIHFKRPSL